MGVKRSGPVVPTDRTQGNVHKLIHRKFHLNMRGNFCTLKEGRALEQAAQRGCGIYSSGDIQNLCGHHPVQPIVAESALAGEWSRQSPEVTFNPNNSRILCMWKENKPMEGSDLPIFYSLLVLPMNVLISRFSS